MEKNFSIFNEIKQRYDVENLYIVGAYDDSINKTKIEVYLILLKQIKFLSFIYIQDPLLEREFTYII